MIVRRWILLVFTSLFFSLLTPVKSGAVVPDLTATTPVNFVLPNFADGISADYLLSGYSVNGDSTKTYLVGISLSGGSSGDYLKLISSTGLTASYGYTSGTNTFSNFTEITFTGSISAINGVLSGSFKYHSFAGIWPGSAPAIKLTITENVAGMAYFAADDHYYKIGHFMPTTGDTPTVNQTNYVFCSDTNTTATSYVDSYSAIESLTIKSKGSNNCTWAEANRLARNTSLKGRPGYLANVTSAGENAFLKDKLQGALNVWMGGTDGASNGAPSTSVASSLTSTPFDYMSNETLTAYSGGTEGLWHYYDGPEAGKIFWRYTGVYACGGYSAGNVNSQARWLEFRTRCETAGYNITGGTQANNYQAVAYSNWANLEPNNSSTTANGEDNVVFNWNTADGYWNDLQSGEPTVSFYGYIIEYGDSTAFSGVSKSIGSLSKNLTITFDSNGGSGSMSSITTKSESSTVLTQNAFTRSGYNFDGWSDSAGGSSNYADSATVSFNNDKTLYAHWSTNSPPGGGGGGYTPPQPATPVVPGITWNPTPLHDGDVLTENQLNAKFSVPGKVTYSIPLGTKMKTGLTTIKVTFIPTDTEHYAIIETTQQLLVLASAQGASVGPTSTSSTTPIDAKNPASIDTTKLTSLGKIYFNNNEFFLDAGDRSKLKEIAATVVENKYKSVLVFGNTDIKKGVDNTWLSRSRAQAVAKYLKQFNLNVRYTQAWFGPTRPVSKGKDPLSLKLNRRVEIYLIK